jgi:hypothetical protein
LIEVAPLCVVDVSDDLLLIEVVSSKKNVQGTTLVMDLPILGWQKPLDVG